MNRPNLVTLLIFVFLIIALPFLTGSAYILTVGIFSGINALVAIGLCILMGYAGQISLGQAAFYGIGAYVSSILSTRYGLPVISSLFLGMLAAAFAAVVLAIPSLRLKGHYLAVATLGFGEVVYIILNEWGPGGPSGFGDIPQFKIFGFVFNSSARYFYLVWLTVAAVIGFSLNLMNSRSGRALKAIHGSELASSATGLDVVMLKIKVFVVSAVYAALAGGLYAHYVTFISPGSFSFFHSILLLMMVVVGGITNLWGGITGAVAITILPELLRQFEEFDVLAYGLILTLSLLFLREGIVPIVIETFRKIKGIRIARS
jgi:branched-chain amino acid transport system permease protein